jgi:hypothetical protein
MKLAIVASVAGPGVIVAMCVASTSARADVTGMFGVGEQISSAGGYAGSQHGLAIEAALA